MSQRISFTAYGDARSAERTSGIQGYREWFWNTLYAANYVPVELAASSAWYGWNGMTVTFSLDVPCGRSIPQLRQNLATVIQRAGLMVDTEVTSADIETACQYGDETPVNTSGGGGSSTPRNNPPANNSGGNNSTPRNTPPPSTQPSSFDEFTAFLKAHETEALFGALILAVLLLRR